MGSHYKTFQVLAVFENTESESSIFNVKKRLLLWSEKVTQNLCIHRDVIIRESGREKTFIFIKGCTV